MENLKSEKLKKLLCTHDVIGNEDDYWICKECGQVGTESYFKHVDKSILHKFARWLIKKLFDDNDNNNGSGGLRLGF